MRKNCFCIDRLRNQIFSIVNIFKIVKLDLRKEIFLFFFEMYFQNSRFKILGVKKSVSIIKGFSWMIPEYYLELINSLIYDQL